MPFIDIHTHNRDPVKDTIKVISLSPETKTPPATDAGNIFTAGIHPWHIEDTDVQKGFRQLENWLKQGILRGMGETGLDAVKGPSPAIQEEIFIKHILLSEKYKVPLIIHCVKRYNEILTLHKRSEAAQPWILHGFGSSVQMMRQFTRAGIFISLGAGLLRNSRKQQEVCREVPDEYLFLETDVSGISINDIYVKAAQLRNVPVKHLRQVIFNNFKKVF